MYGEARTVLCPHCGAENQKSEIVTICHRCFKPLASQPPEVAAARQAPPPPVRPVPLPPEPRLPAPVPPPPPPAAPPPAPPAFEPAQTYAPAPGETVTARPAPPREAPWFRPRWRIWGRLPGERNWVGIIAGGILLVVMVARAGGPVVAVIAIACLVVGGVFAARAHLAAISYEVTWDPTPTSVDLGQTLTWGVTIRAKRPVTLGTARTRLWCEERAVHGSGKSQSVHRNTLLEQSQVFPGQALAPGQAVVLRGSLPVPPTSLPSYRGAYNTIQWTVSMGVPVPGICPDIKKKARLWVVPVIEGAPAETRPEWSPASRAEADRAPAEASAATSGPLCATLQTGDSDRQGMPVVPVGSTAQLNVSLQTEQEIRCRGVRCQVGYRIFGRGNEERKWVSEERLIHEGPLLAGAPITYPLTVTVPAEGPVSFSGQLVNCEWRLRVRVDIPLWPDKRLDLPFVVAPRPRV